MIAYFDDGGDKIVSYNSKGYSLGKLNVSKIWATNVDGIKGTKIDFCNSIEELILHLAQNDPDFSPVYSKEGIEVVVDNSSDPDVVLIQNYRINENNKVVKVGSAKSMKFHLFKENWNSYKNTGISTTPTSGWEDNT